MTFNSNSKRIDSVDAVLGATNAVFPYEQNVSSSAVIQIRQLVQRLLDNLDSDFYDYFTRYGDIVPSTSVERVVIPRETHNAVVDQLFEKHERLRKLAAEHHEIDMNAVLDLSNQLERHRKMNVNAKRVRNTQRNQIRSQMRGLLKLEMELSMKGNHHSVPFMKTIHEQTKFLQTMFHHIKQNYTCTANTISRQIRVTYGQIRQQLCILQKNDENDIGRLIENARIYNTEAHLAMTMALREFAAEKEWNHPGWYRMDARVEKNGSDVVLTIRARGSTCVEFQERLDMSTSKISLETRNEFYASQKPAERTEPVKEWWQTTPTSTAVDEEFNPSPTQYSSWPEVVAVDEEEPATTRAPQEKDEEDIGDADIDFTTGFTPKASSSSSSKRSNFATTSSITKPKKAKKTKKYEPFQIRENTNHTTGSLQNDDDIQSKKKNDLSKMHESGNRNGRSAKDVFERWNKKRSHAKVMSRMCSSE